MPEIRQKYKPQINTVQIIKNHNQSALSAFRYYTTFLPELCWQAGNIQLPIAIGTTFEECAKIRSAMNKTYCNNQNINSTFIIQHSAFTPDSYRECAIFVIARTKDEARPNGASGRAIAGFSFKNLLSL